MTDASDKLDERFAALADPLDDSDWLDVRRRAGRVPRRRRVRDAVAIGAAAVALVAGSALAYYGNVVDFGTAEKAPQDTVEFFEVFSVGAPPGWWDFQAIASETRRIETTMLNGERATVFVAPTKAGGLCYTWEGPIYGGGCDRLGTTPISASYWAYRLPTPMSGISAHVSSRYVTSVELHFEDGTVLRPPITWVSAPIERGFFTYVYTTEQREPGRQLTSVVGLDGEGDIVTEQRPSDRGLPVPPVDAIVTEKTVVDSISTVAGPAVLWTAPTRYEGRCVWLELEDTGQQFGCAPKGVDEGGTSLGLHPTTETVIVFGSIDERYRELELSYADGSVERPTHEGDFFLFEIPQEHLEHRTRLVKLTTRDADGRAGPLSEDTFPATGNLGAPCYRVLPLPPGQTCP